MREASAVLWAVIFAAAIQVCSGDICGKSSRETWEGECSKPAVGGWGVPLGKGAMVEADGSRKDMEFKDGKPVGHGSFVWVNGQTYEGGWLDGVPHGEGTFTWRDGKRYEGQTVEGKPAGFGRFLWPNGERYVGNFAPNGRENGALPAARWIERARASHHPGLLSMCQQALDGAAG